MLETYSTAEVARLAGVHRDTLLRWLREGTVPEPQRDRRGWRTFSYREATAIAKFSHDTDTHVLTQKESDSTSESERLIGIDWDFSAAKTSYLTHNIHPYPAKFIPQIPNALIQELSSVGETVADIFCGSGTTLLEAIQLKRHAIGIDANPLATLISQAKTTALLDHEFEEIEKHKIVCQTLMQTIANETGDLFYSGRDFISDGWRPKSDVCEFWFSPHIVEELAEILLLIQDIKSDAARNLCLVIFSSIVVAVSKQDSDTRYVRREKSIKVGETVRYYINNLQRALIGVRELTDLIEDRFNCQLITQNILNSPQTDPFDLVVCSPPYPNAYSYHLYHRTRLIWLGYNPESFKKIEIGSHRKYSSKGKNKATIQTFRIEFEKIFQWLRGKLRDHRHACFIIGDSTLSGNLVNNCTLISEAANKLGFQEVARINRKIAENKKYFNPRIGKIKTEKILILRKM